MEEGIGNRCDYLVYCDSDSGVSLHVCQEAGDKIDTLAKFPWDTLVQILGVKRTLESNFWVSLTSHAFLNFFLLCKNIFDFEIYMILI